MSQDWNSRIIELLELKTLKLKNRIDDLKHLGLITLGLKKQLGLKI